ncbi:zinc metalloprotease HtpX [Candidatus Beckwithbacteria bacterium CG10_big_fil_rev_8_21_14_0_10_34_10]|uniref:Protease HtpX homolog n=1 Tax=Candidatus Beckwithbacteria bacterium CG10_big_fil_rev_8_21_14_0_10_34_10 TaxID=1974495 RepID=A0A2H0WAA9_9BACT|nr:MAG: zinc metalloprotease HtpX [Candidatus Beckwithbacteria bacterium CG10_big_fil_rev_8_21_14_0_10_34_10]
MLNVFEQIDRNKQKSFLVIVGFIAFIGLATWVFSQVLDFGLQGIGVALIFAGLMSFSSYYWSDKIILSISAARPASKSKDFLFYTVTENLSLAAQIPMPRLYIINDTALNAFATGRDPDHAVVCATSGLLQSLNRTELEGVIAHELSHVKNYDIRLMSMVTVLVGLLTLLADWFLRGSRIMGKGRKKENGQIQGILFVAAIILALLSPLIANLIKLLISRRREFLADAGSALITRQPQGLMSALEKISKDKEPLEAANKATAHLYISNPLKNLHQGVGWFVGLFNTHPPIELRIKALKEML